MPGAAGIMASEPVAAEADIDRLSEACARLRQQVETMEQRLRRSEDRRRAMLHIMADMHETNKRLANHRKAMLHILSDYEDDRRRLMRQAQRLDDSRRAILHILQDYHQSNLRLGRTRKAMIHIMGDLRDTTEEMQRREQELRDKQDQLVQAGKLATLGELTTGVAHELNNPLNNISLFIGNVIDQIDLGRIDQSRIRHNLQAAMQQVRKASEIISHLRTFGRVASVTHEPVSINDVIEQAISLMQEQLRLRGIELELNLSPDYPIVNGNAIQLEQVFINLLTNARDALTDSPHRAIRISSIVEQCLNKVEVSDTGPGIPVEIQHRIFDPFFTTKEVGTGTGLGLSITYGIIQDHGGSISVISQEGDGAMFVIQLPATQADAAPIQVS